LIQTVSPDDEHDMLETWRALKIKINTYKGICASRWSFTKNHYMIQGQQNVKSFISSTLHFSYRHNIEFRIVSSYWHTIFGTFGTYMFHLQTTLHMHSASEASVPPKQNGTTFFNILITGNCSQVFSTSRLFTMKRFSTTLKAALVLLLSPNFPYPTCFYYRLWKIRNICIVGKAPDGKMKLYRLCYNKTDGFKLGRQRHCTCRQRLF
jgi:hypothetical protein